MDLHNRWPHRWVNPKAEARTSAISGMGLFAKETINKDEPVAVLGGVIVPVADLIEYKGYLSQVGVQISDDFFIAPTSRDELDERAAINHSCEPTIGFGDSSIVLVAIRDIQAGEECAIDYALGYSEHMDEFSCDCGSSQCRKRITKDDWKIKSLQEKYRTYFAPFIRAKFEK